MAATGYAGSDPTRVAVAGDTMTGALVLSEDPVAPLQAATKEYVDEHEGGGGSVTITSPDGTITVGGTSSSPTLDVDAITESQVTGLPAALTANAAAITAETSRAETAEGLAAQKSANLTDLASASSARTALGLGTAATENVGTTSGTVAAGNDSRIVGAIQSGAAAGGDLGGTLPSPTVTATHLAAPLPVAQGGTGSSTQDFVDLSTDQTIAGTKVFTGQDLRLGPTSYPFTPANSNSANNIVDRNATGGDASTIYRDQGAARAEGGLDGGDVNYHLKAATGSAGSETYTDALIVRNSDAAVEIPVALGVGTMPAEPLHVAGSSTVARITGKIENTNASGSSTSVGAQFNLVGNGVNFAFGTDVGLNGGDNFFLVNANGAYMTGFIINAAGQLGILTDSPGSALDVNGAVTVRGDNTLSPLRFRGRQTTTGTPTAGTWSAADAIVDSTGALWVCTAGGTPGTWNGVQAAVATETARAEAAEALLAPKASPTFTGTVTVPSTVNATDAAQKAYVDAVAQGLNAKPSVVAAATANLTLSGTQTVDGVALTAGQRSLAVGQTVGTQNGIWVVQSGPWARPADFATGSTQQGAYVFVEAGTANGSSGWTLTGTSVTVDVSAQTWTQFSGAGEVIAGSFLSKSGNTLSALTGSSSSTLAVGNDSRITGALQSASNLSDVANAATARGNLAAASLASPAFTGTPTAPTQTTGDSSTKLATDAFVAAATAPLAPLASPAFTGIPTTPTATPLTNNTQAATTAYTDLAVGVETTRATAAEALRQILAPAPQINRGRATVVTTYASGHGWTAAGGWTSSNVNDTADGRLSGQMLTGTTPGNTGTFPTFTKTAASALNIVGQCLRVWVKVDVPTNAAAITLRVADSGGLAASRYISWTALASSGGTYRTNGVLIPANTWTELSFSLGSAFTSGTPNLAAITEYRWICQDNGTAFTAHFGGIEAYPALSARFPNGVVCLGFDDCYSGQYGLAMNLLSSFGFTATLFPIIDQIGAGGSYTLAQLQQMANIGWEVAPHAYTLANHSGWNSLTAAQVAADVGNSRTWIAAQGFGLSGMFAYPLGGFNGGFAAAVAPLAAVARTIDSTMMTESLPIGNELQLRSAAGVGGTGGIGVTTYTTATTGVLALAKTAGALVPITIHDVSSGTSGNINQISIADLTTLVTAINTAGMAVATYGEVLEYAMLGANVQPLTAANSTITIGGTASAPTVAVTPNTFVTPAGGSSTVAPTTALARREDTAANWTANNPVLANGEVAFESDTKLSKLGNGSTAWNSLGYNYTGPVASNNGTVTIGGTTALPTLTVQPPLWVPSQQGLIAATGDGAMMPSQSAVTTGRPFFVPVVVDNPITATGIITGYISATSGVTDANTFVGIYANNGTPYASGGALLAQTSDIGASLTTVAGARVIAALQASLTGLTKGEWIYFCLLNNYTPSASGGPQWISSRNFATNLGAGTGIIPRLYTNSSGSTMTTLPGTVPTLAASNTNQIPWLALSPNSS